MDSRTSVGWGATGEELISWTGVEGPFELAVPTERTRPGDADDAMPFVLWIVEDELLLDDA
jgi:hypothetical protein